MYIRQISPCLFFSQISKSVQEKGGTSSSQQPSDGQNSTQPVPEDIFSYYEQMDKEEEEEEETQTVSFEIRQVDIRIFFLFQYDIRNITADGIHQFLSDFLKF